MAMAKRLAAGRANQQLFVSMTAEVSVIVPAYNAETTIGACVVALREQSFDRPYEIIVVDDGSTDETAARAREAGATVLSTPRGRPAAARNAGIHAASGKLLCCTDADCVPHPDWLQQICAPFDDPEVAACKGAYATRQRSLIARFVQLEYEDKYDLLRTQESIDFIDTYSAAYRRDILLAHNGFDERFDYLEDQELSFRLANRGYRMVFQEAAVVDHLHSATPAAYLRKKATIGYWKAQVVRRFPGKVVGDSHTPQVMKVQMLLVMAIAITLIAGPLLVAALGAKRWAHNVELVGTSILFLSLIFLLTTVPFVRKAWNKDRAVAAVSPLLLFGRATALSAGYLIGTLRPRRDIGSEPAATKHQFILKRGIDLAGAIIGIVFTLIIWPLVALAIKLDSKGPVLFRQERIGEQGRPFIMIKFRTMQVGAAEQWPELVTSLGLTEPVLKLDNDPRLTTVGRFLRRWSLDEFPQFWNVLKGDMSLVGPRPEEPRVVAYYSDRHRQRLAVKPGITGPMQINARADLSLDERVDLDLDYIEHYSPGRDLAILARTIPVVLRGKGAR